MSVKVVSAHKSFFSRFHSLLDRVAKEYNQIDPICAEDLSVVEKHQSNLIDQDLPVYYAVNLDEVVGWCFIERNENPRFSHRGFMSFGMQKKFRGTNKRFGTNLIKEAMNHARRVGFEKVEVSVFSKNKDELDLYKKFGFTEIGTFKHFRKFNDEYIDSIFLEYFF